MPLYIIPIMEYDVKESVGNGTPSVDPLDPERGETVYIAMIGDLVSSRLIPDRQAVQRTLKDILKKINDEHQTIIASRFTITLGDEFQGLLSQAESLFNMMETVKRAMHPVRIRFGIGVGDITTDIDPTLSIGADGPAFYNARDSIEAIRKLQQTKWSVESELRIKTANAELDELLNTALATCSWMERHWSKRQREIIETYRLYTDQRLAAERLGINQSSVHRGLKNSGFYLYLSAREVVTRNLQTLMGH